MVGEGIDQKDRGGQTALPVQSRFQNPAAPVRFRARQRCIDCKNYIPLDFIIMMDVTWIVFVSLSRVPMTITLWPS